ncbi:MAG: ABC transporter permease [Bdellovibrionota bacterium]
MSEALRPKPPLYTKWIFAFTLILLYLPIGMMMVNSFLNNEGFTLEWYEAIFQDNELIESLLRSLIVSFSAGAVASVIGTLGAIALLRSQSILKEYLEFFSTVSLILPELVFALSLLSWFFILKLDLSLFTVIIAHVTFTISFVMLTVGARLSSLDISIEDAARDLGANDLIVLWKVILPLLKPAIVTGFILSFLISFDDFLITFYTNGLGSDTLPIKLYSAMKVGLSPKLSALSTLMFLFTLILTVIFFRTQNVKELIGQKKN